MSFLGLDVGLCQFPYLQFHSVQFRKLWFVRHLNDHAEPGHQFLRVRKDKNSPIISGNSPVVLNLLYTVRGPYSLTVALLSIPAHVEPTQVTFTRQEYENTILPAQVGVCTRDDCS